MTSQAASRQRYARNVIIAAGALVLVVWTVFPFFWFLLALQVRWKKE